MELLNQTNFSELFINYNCKFLTYTHKLDIVYWDKDFSNADGV